MKKKGNKHQEEIENMDLPDFLKMSSFLFQKPIDMTNFNGAKFVERLLESGDLTPIQRKRLIQIRRHIKNYLASLIFIFCGFSVV